MKYIDFHTHASRLPDAHCLSIRSFHQEEEEACTGWSWPCSAGLHPWMLDPEQMAGQWAWLERALQAPQVRMVGEAGLDRLRGPELAFQQSCFERQLEMAVQHRKPVVIHCVRAFSELRQSILRVNPGVDLTLHGFNKSSELAALFLEIGASLSFGAAILRKDQPAVSALRTVPVDRLWLETDDSGVAIEAIYACAAEAKGVPEEELTHRLYERAKKWGLV
ncbi:MAG: TatD family hydrolase [Haliscomenobacter sp.]|nr:TatD family hydrolase [Haliscomenobacter sp.]